MLMKVGVLPNNRKEIGQGHLIEKATGSIEQGGRWEWDRAAAIEGFTIIVSGGQKRRCKGRRKCATFQFATK